MYYIVVKYAIIMLYIALNINQSSLAPTTPYFISIFAALPGNYNIFVRIC